MALFVKWVACLITIMHPVHVSFTNVEYLKEEKELSISFQLFTEDFELLFDHLYEADFDLTRRESVVKYQKEIDQYFNDHFRLKYDDLDLTLENKDIKATDEFTWFYYQVHLQKHLPDEIVVYHSVLLDFFIDQKNLLIIKNGNFEQGHQFDIRKKEILISLP